MLHQSPQLWTYPDELMSLEEHEPLRLRAGAGDTLYRNKKKGNIAVDFPNKAWRSPNHPKGLASEDSGEALDEEDEAWLETVNMHAAAAGQH